MFAVSLLTWKKVTMGENCSLLVSLDWFYIPVIRNDRDVFVFFFFFYPRGKNKDLDSVFSLFLV